jgi:hypothetical protein
MRNLDYSESICCILAGNLQFSYSQVDGTNFYDERLSKIRLETSKSNQNQKPLVIPAFLRR